ncbi:MAG: hypothetical protein ACKOXO_01530 [Cyanobium sp.]
MTLPDDRLLPEGAPQPPQHDPTWQHFPTDAEGEVEIDPAVHRRLTVAVCWAVSRRACLDGRELYEESYALNEEFREWLVCLEDHPEELQASVLMVPRDLEERLRCGGFRPDWARPESDGLLEI